MSTRTFVSWCVLFSASTMAHAATFEIRPVSATSPFVLSGDEILLPDGLSESAVVTFDIFVSGWSPALLRGAQFWRLVSGGTSGSITPYGPACTYGWDCDVLVGPHGNCNGHVCGFGFFDDTRSDFVFDGSPIFTGSEHDFAGLTTNEEDSVADPGTPKYLGSFRMQAAPGSDGTFTISFDLTSSRTFWVDDAQTGFEPLVTPAKISFDSVAFAPAVGAWGSVVMALALACAVTLRIGRVRTA